LDLRCSKSIKSVIIIILKQSSRIKVIQVQFGAMPTSWC